MEAKTIKVVDRIAVVVTIFGIIGGILLITYGVMIITGVIQ